MAKRTLDPATSSRRGSHDSGRKRQKPDSPGAGRPRRSGSRRGGSRKAAPTGTITATRDLVVIGGSGGGLEAVSVVLRALPEDFPAAVAVVLHRGNRGPNVLTGILGRLSKLPVEEVTKPTAIRAGHVCVPAQDHHLVIEAGSFRVSRGPKENYVRPAIDPLFRTAARHYGARTIGVILTGSLDDGTAGLLAIKRRGGMAVVQDPDEAMYDSMPRSAVDHVAVDYQVPLADIAGLLGELAGHEVTVTPPEPLEEVLFPADRQNRAGRPAGEQAGAPTILSCPGCGGGLVEVRDGQVLRFVCHTGHQFTADSLMEGKIDDVESALWSALRALKEKAELTARMIERARERGDMGVAARYSERVKGLQKQVATLRELIERM